MPVGNENDKKTIAYNREQNDSKNAGININNPFQSGIKQATHGNGTPDEQCALPVDELGALGYNRQPPPETPPPKKSGKAGLVTICLVLFLALGGIAVLLCVLLDGDGSSKKTDKVLAADSGEALSETAPVSAETEASPLTEDVSGLYGEYFWSLDTSGVLTISGNGQMEGFTPNSTAAWLAYRNNIKAVIIAENAESIGDYAFFGCNGLEAAELHSTVKSIGVSAFEGCHALYDLILPDSIDEIRERAFMSCKSLLSVTLPKHVAYIAPGAFACCDKLKAFAVDSANVDYKAVNGVLFSRGTSGLICYPAGKSGSFYAVPESAAAVAPYAFAGCNSLTSVSITEGVGNVGDYAFAYCGGLTAVSIPPSVMKIGNFVFAYSPALTDLNYGDLRQVWEEGVTKGEDWDAHAASFTVYFKE